MCDRERKIENFELFKGDIQDERQLAEGSEVLQNNARQREVMQQDLHKAHFCNIDLCHCLFNQVVSLLQLSATGDISSHHCPLFLVSPCLVPPQSVSTMFRLVIVCLLRLSVIASNLIGCW